MTATGDEPRTLEKLRSLIDNVDNNLVQLLNERARLVVEVGKRKSKDGTPVYAPAREQMVLKKVLSLNTGPLLNTTLEAVYREIMSGSFALERPLRIGYLGPAGSYSHEAATKQFGSSVSYENLRTIAGVFEEVARGHVDYGLVPVENVMIGGVAETLDGFLEFSDTVSVCAEVQLAINHALIAAPGARPADITSIHSKPEAIAQCRRWLSTQYPHADIVHMTSTSAAIELVAETFSAVPDKAIHMAAIGSRLGASHFELPVMFPEIQDVSPNVTRFLVLCSSKTPAATTLASGMDRTSILFVCQDRPGALKDVLDAFASEGINLSHIEKRPCPPVTLAKLVSRSSGAGDLDKPALPSPPSPVKAAVETGLPPSLFVPALSGGRGSVASSFVYAFVIEADGHITQEAMARTIQEATKHCVCLQVLGSFPAARRIL